MDVLSFRVEFFYLVRAGFRFNFQWNFPFPVRIIRFVQDSGTKTNCFVRKVDLFYMRFLGLFFENVYKYSGTYVFVYRRFLKYHEYFLHFQKYLISRNYF